MWCVWVSEQFSERRNYTPRVNDKIMSVASWLARNSCVIDRLLMSIDRSVTDKYAYYKNFIQSCPNHMCEQLLCCFSLLFYFGRDTAQGPHAWSVIYTRRNKLRYNSQIAHFAQYRDWPSNSIDTQKQTNRTLTEENILWAHIPKWQVVLNANSCRL